MADKIWHGAGQTAAPQDGLMNYGWPEGLLPLEMDDLGLLSSAAPNVSEPVGAPQMMDPSMADEMVLRKRKRERADQESVESILAHLGREEDDDSPYEDKRPARAASGSKASAASAARNKACRERQRRERLNDRFAELAKVLEPGKAAKTDKTNIIDDAMRIVTQLRGENGQLRQLNKFLEERVAQCEKAKSELMLQQALMQQSAGLAAGPSSLLGNTRLFQPSPLGQGIVQGVAVGLPAMKAPQPGQQMPQAQQGQQLGQPLQSQASGSAQPQGQGQDQQQKQQQAQQQPAQHAQQPGMLQAQGSLPQQSMMQSQGSLPQGLQLQFPPAMALPFHQQLQQLQQMQQQPQHQPQPQAQHQQQQQQGQQQQQQLPVGSSPPPDAALSFANATFPVKQEFQHGLMLPGSLPFVPNMSSWLPPSTLDTSQDSMRRPPAA